MGRKKLPEKEKSRSVSFSLTKEQEKYVSKILNKSKWLREIIEREIKQGGEKCTITSD